ADSWWKLCHPDDRASVKASIAHAHATGEIDVEYRVVHPDGKEHWLNQKGRTFFDPDGKPVRSIGFIQDVTERKQAEDGMRQLEQKLRRAQRLEAMGTFAGGIAHDFNNILGAILGYGELAQNNLAEGSAVRRQVDQVMQAGARGKGLVERILAFSRNGIGERVPVQVQSVVEETLELLAASLPADVRLERRLDAVGTSVVGDATQFHQVVMNLCTNALHAMDRSGVLSVVLERVTLGERRV